MDYQQCYGIARNHIYASAVGKSTFCDFDSDDPQRAACSVWRVCRRRGELQCLLQCKDKNSYCCWTSHKVRAHEIKRDLGDKQYHVCRNVHYFYYNRLVRRGSEMATTTIAFTKSNIVYVPNETQTIYPCYGYITNSGKTMHLNFPVPKLYWYVSSVSLSSSSLSISIRHVGGGYVGGSSGFVITGKSNITNSWTLTSGVVHLESINSSGWGVTNNTPVAGFCSGTVKFS